MCVIPSSHPQYPGTKQKEGWEVRSGAAATFPSPRHSVILWARQTNRPGPRARWAQQGGIARSAYSLGQDRTGWQPLIDAAHYFHPHKTGTLTNRETPWQLGYEVTGRGLFIPAKAATFVNSATQERTQNTFDWPTKFCGCSLSTFNHLCENHARHF